jgi:hypothetical protein
LWSAAAMLHSKRNLVGCVVGFGAPKMEAMASVRRPSGSGGKGESTKGRGIVGKGTWLWDVPFVGRRPLGRPSRAQAMLCGVSAPRRSPVC